MNGLRKSDGTTFWELPEGKVAKVLSLMAIAAAGVGALFFTAQFLAFFAVIMATIFESTLTIALSFIGLAAITSPLWNDRAAALAKYVARLPLRLIAGIFTTLDPIGIRENYLEEKIQDQKKLTKQISAVEGIKNGLEEAIKTNVAAAERSTGIAKQAVLQQKRSVFRVESNQHARLTSTNEEYAQMLSQVNAYLAQMYQWNEKGTESIADLRNEIENEKVRLEMIRKTYAALSFTKRMLKHSAAMDLSTQAAMKIKREYNAKFGEIEQFRKESEAMFESFSLETGMMEANMMQKLMDAEQRSGQQLQSPVMTTRLLPASTASVDESEFAQAVKGKEANDIDSLFKR